MPRLTLNLLAALACSSLLAAPGFALSKSVGEGAGDLCVYDDPVVAEAEVAEDRMAGSSTNPCIGTWCGMEPSTDWRKPACGCSFGDPGGSCTREGSPGGSDEKVTCKTKDGRTKITCKRNSNGQGCICTRTTT